MEKISIHKTSIQLLTLENTFSSLPACHSARRACPELQNPLLQKAKGNLLPGEKAPVSGRMRGGKKEIFPTPRSPSTTLTHRLRRSPPSRRARVILGMINEKWNQEGVTPRSLSFLLLSNSMVKRRRIETTTSKVATARMVGLICSRIPENICQGMVRWR